MEKIIDRLKNIHNESTVGIIGDSVLDKYIYGKTKETDNTVFIPEKKYYYLGGAANVANNVLSKVCNMIYISVYGYSDKAKIFNTLLKGKGLNNSIIINDNLKDISLKTRFVCNNKILMRVDEDCIKDINENISDKLYNQVKYNIKVNKLKILILSNYNKGCISEELHIRIKKLCKFYNVKLLVDSNQNYDYSDIFLFKPNLAEFEKITERKFSNRDELIKAGLNFKRDNNIQNLLITMDRKGLIFINQTNECIHMKSLCNKIIDSCGAGDSMIATIAACLAKDIDINSAIELSNYSAAVCCNTLGTYATTISDIESLWRKLNS